jgi:hypothetical protein
MHKSVMLPVTRQEVQLVAAHTHTLLLALHLAGPFGGPQLQILLRTLSIAEPGCRLLLSTGATIPLFDLPNRDRW